MTYYDILEISEKASQEVICMAYKALCKKYHPDVYQGDKNFAEEQMKKINEAYDILSNVEKRREYDNSFKKQNNEKKNNENNYDYNYTTFNIKALLKRGFLTLEDGDWLKADAFFEEVLNRDAELAEAYLGKLMIDLRVNTREMLKNCALPFDNKNNYIKALRFSDSSLKKFLVDTIQYINRRNYETECDITYMEACKLAKCDNNIESLENAILLFKKILNYKESSFKIKECEEKIQMLREEIALKNQKEEVKRKKAIKLASIIITSIAIVLTLAIIITTSISNSGNYKNALILIDEGKYEEAITVLQELDDYKNTQELLQETQYNYAKKLFQDKKYIESKEEFNKIVSYKDSKEQIALCDDNINEINYLDSLTLLDEQKFIEAYSLLNELASKNYKDSKSLMDKYNDLYERAVFNNKLKTAEIGSIVTFGSYEQDDNLENGKEAVEWIILDRDQESTMLISKNIIEYQPYLNVGWGNYRDTTWEKCTLRKWLNSTFYNTLFSENEKQYVKSSSVVPDPKEYSTSVDPGNETIDKVYLLSEREYNKYKNIYGVADCGSSRFVLAKERNGYDRWWLRSPDNDYLIFAKEVYSADYIATETVDHDNGIRPVVWLNFK